MLVSSNPQFFHLSAALDGDDSSL